MTRATDIIESSDISIPTLFAERVRRSPGSPAYHHYVKKEECWRSLSWSDTAVLVDRWRAGLQSEALGRGNRVAVLLPNGINWVCFDLAAQSLGLVVVPLYANDRPDNITYILEQTESRVLLCLGPFFRERLAMTLGSLQALQRIILVEEDPSPSLAPSTDPRVVELDTWLPVDGQQAGAFPAAEDLATIVYTSGTTGRPKGVMLSHRNMVSNAAAGLSCIPIYPDDLLLSFLPLSHMLERTAGYYLPMMAGASVAYARSIQLLSDDLAERQPTVLVAVPKIFEKLHSKIRIKLAEESPAKQQLFNHAADIGWRSYLRRQGRASWSPNLLLHPLLDALVGRKVRGRLGGRLRVVISGGAALSFEVARTLIGLGITIYQGYGLTEASPIISVNRIEDNRPEGVGLLLPGLAAKTGEFDELLVRGPNVMLGYWRNPEATAAVLDAEGWLRTGDTARIEDGHLRITGRLKEILVLSNGEKVSPTDVETAIAADPLFEQNLVIGEGRPYLTVLAVLNAELWQQLAAQMGVPADEASLADHTIRAMLLKRIEGCLKHFPGFAWIKDIHLSLNPWTIEQGFLTPTMKLRRKNILSAFHDEVERLYQA
ncbi:AMP-dependent synthetase/ligase [Desulfofustis limnaeus]|jgi:long-chain acyl-CoA synthetase|uniref:AMP-dependent synthetase n=1 Tax=Desulfofustis limnaeus TaxID=2740163 RepID=A0ABN6MB82_9BACT|nr:long-chain fatty acid--CoA ligase [Desulfofustis limnaeus]MDX9896708.1 long-chain fatty acid--CoA ligase [Desulfofustis sp.]BDD88742.1 AMP-dependent synthetase [Desulfofustis limnaeus]